MFAVHVASDSGVVSELVRVETDCGVWQDVYISNVIVDWAENGSPIYADEIAVQVVPAGTMHASLRDEYDFNKTLGAWSWRTVAIVNEVA